MKCYICNGKTFNSKFAHICQQEFGPCGWLWVHKNHKAQEGDSQKTFWEKTRHNHKRGPIIRISSEGTHVLIHIGPDGVNTTITDLVTEIDERHIVELY